MSPPLRAAVLGCGHFGRYHAEKYAAMDDVDLVAVVDHDIKAARAVAERHGVRAETDCSAILGSGGEAVDLVSIATPTSTHEAVAIPFLERGIHALVEKPIAETLESADAMLAAAVKGGAFLQIGHIERFSMAYRAIRSRITRPLYIESYRIASFNPRIRDVNVVLDLMIHDIDMVLALIDSPLVRVDAVGAPVITKQEDIANARLNFENGCVANITASRVSDKTERTMRIFQPDSYTVVDFHKGQIRHMTKGGKPLFPGYPGIQQYKESFEAEDALAAEIRAFVDSIRSGHPPQVDGMAGRNALDAAIRIGTSLREHLDLVSREYSL